jgi:polyisoprenoid-binding protein YceI
MTMAETSTVSTSTLASKLANGELVGAWKLDPSRSKVALRTTSMWGLAPVKGVFHDVEGSGTVSTDGAVTGQIAVAAASIDTKIKKRDAHLCSDDFFAAATHPSIVFDLEHLELSAKGVEASGTLTVKTTSKHISFPADLSADDDGTVRLSATIEVDRSEFGMTWNKMGMTSMKNALSIDALFIRS